MSEGADSSVRFSAAAARAAGMAVGARYLRAASAGGITTAEVQDYQANGLVLLPIVEFDGHPNGYADGQSQGNAAKAWLPSLGLAGYGCAFTDDVSGYPYSKVQDTMKGVRSTFAGHVVYYGPSHYGDQLVAEGLADSVWIEGAWSFSPGYNPHNPTAPTAVHSCGTQYPNQFKINGVTVDYNTFTRYPWLPGSGPSPEEPTMADLEALFTKYLGITPEQAAAGVTVAQFHVDTRADAWARMKQLGGFTADPTARDNLSTRMTGAGWASRPYCYRASDQDAVYVVTEFATGASNADGTPHMMLGRRWITTQRSGGDSQRVLGVLVRLGLNPDVQVLDRTNPDDAADLLELEAFPILNVSG